MNGLRIKDATIRRFGWIPYWNMAPLRVEFMRQWRSNVSLLEGHPSQVNQWLSDGTVEMAPCSSALLLRNPQVEIAMPLGVAATGAVKSVYLAVPRSLSGLSKVLAPRMSALSELAKVGRQKYGDNPRAVARFIMSSINHLPQTDLSPPPMALSGASASGALLSRLFYFTMFGDDAYEERCHDGGLATVKKIVRQEPALELLIGDDALIRRSQFHEVIDLGSWWSQVFGLPFVFAIWQGRNDQVHSLTSIWRSRIMKVAALAQARMHVEATDYFPDVTPLCAKGHELDLAAYWKCLHYRLTEHDFAGLMLFLALGRELLSHELDEAILIKLMRWQEQVFVN